MPVRSSMYCTTVLLCYCATVLLYGVHMYILLKLRDGRSSSVFFQKFEKWALLHTYLLIARLHTFLFLLLSTPKLGTLMIKVDLDEVVTR